MDRETIESIVEEVLGRVSGGASSAPRPASAPSKPASPRGPSLVASGRPGVFTDGATAAAKAREGFDALRKKGISARARVIGIVKQMCVENADNWGRIELEETGIGRLPDKIGKLQTIPKVPGVEWIRPFGFSGDAGISMEEHSPFGVVAAIAPVTHSIPTIACNIINMVAAGNGVVVNAHPGGAKCAAMAVAAFNQAIRSEVGIENLITIIEEPTIESFNALCASPHVDLICVTGGPAVVKAAMSSGKRAICAGPGNPPVIVDETANLRKAAADVIAGGAFDNNLLCIGEKQVFVLEKVYREFCTALEAAGAVRLDGRQVEKLTAEAFQPGKDAGGCSHPVLNRKLVGNDAAVLAEIAGARAPADTPMVYGETDGGHLFVQEEQMMPFLPVVPVSTFGEAVRLAKESEHGYKHSAMIHSSHVGHMTEMGRALDSTVFVKNGPCVAGLGLGGEGYISFSIATTTGEGITTPLTFTRTRRCVLVDALNVG